MPAATRRSAALILCALALACPRPSSAQSAPARRDAPPPIRDNLFLLEEAYNQEPGVVQHIQNAVWSRRGTFDYSVTDEWPAPSERHQLSLTVPVSRALGEPAGVGDILVNYRLQALSTGALAVAPRVSLVVATPPDGAPRSTSLGLQLNLPISIELGRSFVTHLNGGLTLAPGVQALTRRTTLVDTNAGAALVWLASPCANAVFEVLHTSAEDVRPDGTRGRRGELTLNPGVRFALNFRSGLQIVPGFSVPVRFPSGEGGRAAVLAYLSFEHPVWRPGR